MYISDIKIGFGKSVKKKISKSIMEVKTIGLRNQAIVSIRIHVIITNTLVARIQQIHIKSCDFVFFR